MTRLEIRMACLKLAIGDATPLDLVDATTVVSIAKVYADFLLEEGGDPSTAPALAEAEVVGEPPPPKGLL